MLRRNLIGDALTEAARALEAAPLPPTRREQLLRLALVSALGEYPEIVEITSEWRPEMKWWPWLAGGKKKLGGFDLALRFENDTSYSLVAELKWSRHGFIDALDEAPWDAFKLAHAAATLDGVDHGLLVYAAPSRAWDKPARFVDLFTNSLISTRTLIAENESVWRWCLAGSAASRPVKLPPSLQTGPVARVAFLADGVPWELRAATVAGNGEPWLDLDENGMPTADDAPVIFDWPYPAPGPYMEADDPSQEFRRPRQEPSDTPSSELDASIVPSPGATWSEIIWFAAQFDGYRHYGNEPLGELANTLREHWQERGEIDAALSLDDLRGCLFFEYRRFRMFGHSPSHDDSPYIRALVEAIRARLLERA